MTPRTIWRLDRWLGIPACAILTPWARLERSRKILLYPVQPRRILFVKLIEMGSTVLAAPAFEEAARHVGRENIFLLVFRSNRPIADILPCFFPDHILTLDDRNLLTLMRDFGRVRQRVAAAHIDAAIDMEGLTRASAVITYLLRTRYRVGYYNFTAEGPYRGRLFTHELNYTFQHHVSRMFLSMVYALFAPMDQTPFLKETIPDEKIRLPMFTPSENDIQEIRTLLAPFMGNDTAARLVLLNPNCSDLLPLRRWPTDHFVDLGRVLLSQIPDVHIVITGAPSEEQDCARMAQAIGNPPRVFSLAGRTTLRQLLTLYTMSHVLVSNDSGPCHFASLTSIATIALFGPETPALYGPLGPRVHVLSAGLACSPCVNLLNHRFSPCRDNVCMRRIRVQQVAAAVQRVLAESDERKRPLPHA